MKKPKIAKKNQKMVINSSAILLRYPILGGFFEVKTIPIMGSNDISAKRRETMYWTKILATSVLLISLVGWGQAKIFPVDHPPHIPNELAAEEHWEASELYTETLVQLETKVAHLEKRIERFTKKPYLDTKGFKAQGAKNLIGAYNLEIAELRKHVAWHENEAKRLSELPPPNEGNTSKTS